MSNPFHETLARRIAVQRMSAANVSDSDLAAIVRQIAVGAATGDDRAISRIASAGPAMRAIIEAELDRVLEEQRSALDQRRAAAGVTAAADESRPAEATHPAPEPENAPAATTPTATAYVTPPGCRPRLDGGPAGSGIEIDYSGRPPRPVPPPPFSAARYGLRETPRRERTGWWLGNR